MSRWNNAAESKLQSITATAQTMLASAGLGPKYWRDALSTAAFVLGPEKALKMFRRIAYPAEAVIVGADCQVYTTPKIKKHMRLNVELIDGRLPGCNR